MSVAADFPLPAGHQAILSGRYERSRDGTGIEYDLSLHREPPGNRRHTWSDAVKSDAVPVEARPMESPPIQFRHSSTEAGTARLGKFAPPLRRLAGAQGSGAPGAVRRADASRGRSDRRGADPPRRSECVRHMATTGVHRRTRPGAARHRPATCTPLSGRHSLPQFGAGLPT